jgi:hypothetical protein
VTPRPFFKVFRFGGYPFHVIVSCGMAHARLDAKLRKMNQLAKNERIEEFDVSGRATQLPTGNILVQLSEMPDTSNGLALLVHELFHATVMLMDQVGVKLSDDSDEAFAYALQDMTQQAVTAMVSTVKRRPSRKSR